MVLLGGHVFGRPGEPHPEEHRGAARARLRPRLPPDLRRRLQEQLHRHLLPQPRRQLLPVGHALPLPHLPLVHVDAARLDGHQLLVVVAGLAVGPVALLVAVVLVVHVVRARRGATSAQASEERGPPARAPDRLERALRPHVLVLLAVAAVHLHALLVSPHLGRVREEPGPEGRPHLAHPRQRPQVVLHHEECPLPVALPAPCVLLVAVPGLLPLPLLAEGVPVEERLSHVLRRLGRRPSLCPP